jgi:hypothetical protein
MEPEETSVSTQRFGKKGFGGNGDAHNNRGIVENDTFYVVRAEML